MQNVPPVNIRTKDDLLLLVKKQNSKQTMVCFYINVGYFYQRIIDHQFRDSFKKAQYIHLNSFYIGWLLRMTTSHKFSKLNAEDFIYDVLEICEQKKKKVFLLGSTLDAQKTALASIKTRHKKLQIQGHHGYQLTLSTISQINNFNTDVLLVGLGFGNQEKWVVENLTNLKNTKLIITIGNFIDILGQRRSLPPPWFKHHNLEWLWRLAKEPKRLWKRYLLGSLLATFIFCYALLTKTDDK